MFKARRRARHTPTTLRSFAWGTCGIWLLTCGEAGAYQIDTGNPDLTLRWDNTVKYSNAFRLKSRSATLTQDANQDDGNRNFGRGLISNRFDLLSEFDLSYRSVGARISASAWYDDVYNRSNDNDSPRTANAYSVANNRFVHPTRVVNGRNARLLDAFVYAKGSLADMPYVVRLGQHTVLYGETLFFGSNGIAAAQSPVDVNKLMAAPSTQYKELAMPQPQLSMQLQLNAQVSLGAYYQFRWEPDRLPPVGSYFSGVDILQQGGERILAGAPLLPGGPPAAFFRAPDQKARNSGQGGIQLKWRPASVEGEFGFYAAQFNAKAPIGVTYPSLGFNPLTGQIGSYALLYPNKIRTVGASFTTSVGDANLSGEVSLRHNMPLVPAGGSLAIGADGQAHYPVGKTLHANLSALVQLPRTRWWDGGSLLGELAYHRRLSISRNAGALEPNSTRDALAMRALFSPSYYQVLPGLDLNVPIGIGYNLMGRSSVLTSFNGGAYHGGDLSIGLSGVYQQKWNFSLTWTHFLGAAKPGRAPVNAARQNYTYGQSLKDRDFLAFSISRTF